MKLYTLGTSHGRTEIGRACSGHLLEVNGAYYLFDCGGDVECKITDLEIPFDDIRAVFITHMHEDHVGTLSSVVKRFYYYNKTDSRLTVYMPEQYGIDVFKKWYEAMHMRLTDKVEYKLVEEGDIYSDENITVSAIPTLHVRNGEFPSYAYAVRTEDKKFLYTGDLNGAFSDYPQIVFEEDFDAILCELVHFNVEKNLDTIIKSRTKRIIFTHTRPQKILEIQANADKFPFHMDIAEDGKLYEI